MTGGPAAEEGSILVETMIAAAIVAMILGAALQTIGINARGARLAQEHRLAALVAQSRLASVGGEIPLLPGRYEGREGALAWAVEISPYERAVASRAGQPMRVAVAVGEAGGVPAVTLNSLRMAR